MDPHFEGVIFKTHAGELRRRLRVPFPPFCVVDVRPREEYERAHIPGSVSATASALAGGLPAGTTERTEFFVVGARAEDPEMRAASIALRRLGAHRVVEVTGGIPEWELAGGAQEGTEGGRRAA